MDLIRSIMVRHQLMQPLPQRPRISGMPERRPRQSHHASRLYRTDKRCGHDALRYDGGMWLLYTLTMSGCVRSTCAPTVDTLDGTEDLTVEDVEALSEDLGLAPELLSCDDFCDAYIVSAAEDDYDGASIESCGLELDLSSFADGTSTAPLDEVIGRVDCTLETMILGSETFGSCG